jgi:hypothetical protein
MAYKAFVIGINTPGLKYCDRDAALIEDALSRHGYDVYVINREKGRYEILQEFVTNLSKCLKVDTVIFYFSGHGWVDKGELFLITKGHGSDEFSKIPVVEILGPFSRCFAKNKLIILDCCHAARVGASWNNPQPSEVYRILIAANPLETAKEIEDLGSSFLAHSIHLALTKPSKNILDKGTIRLSSLSRWLREQADLYNGTSPEKVPQPYLIGSDKADFEVCTFERSYIDPMVDTISNTRLINELKEWKLIHTKSQSLQDNLSTMINYLNMSQFNPNDINKWLESAESEWMRCVSLFNNMQEIVKDFRYIAEAETVQQCLQYTNKTFIKSISDQIRTANSPENALSIKQSVSDIKLDIDNALHVADLQIVRLVDKLAAKSSSETVEVNHVNTEA